MAQHFFDFDEFAAGDIATATSGAFTVQRAGGENWTQTIIDLGGGDMAAAITRVVESGDPINIVTADAFEVAAGVDIEVYCEFTIDSLWAADRFCGGVLAASDDRVYAIRYSAASGPDAYRLGLVNNTNGSSSGAVGGYYEMARIGAGTVVCVRIGCYNRAVAQAIRGKIWLKSGSEPGSWLWDGAEATLNGALRPALYGCHGGNAPYTFLAFGVGTGGDPAPTIGEGPVIDPGVILPPPPTAFGPDRGFGFGY